MFPKTEYVEVPLIVTPLAVMTKQVSVVVPISLDKTYSPLYAISPQADNSVALTTFTLKTKAKIAKNKIENFEISAIARSRKSVGDISNFVKVKIPLVFQAS